MQEAGGQTRTQYNIAQVVAQIFYPQKGKRLVWNGLKPDGTKNQYWQNQDIDWSLHLAGKLKQGGALGNDGYAKSLVVDIDQDIDAEKICEEAWKINTKLICFRSPSKRWHIWEFFPEPKTLKEVSEEATKLERIFKKKGYEVDSGHTLPKANGSQLGINFPLHTHQMPYAPNGQEITIEQFIHRRKFQHYPLIAAAAGMKKGGRHTALVKIAALLEQENKFQHLDEVIENFGTKFTDTGYIKRIKEKEIHKKYDIGDKGLGVAITEIVGFEYKLPDPDIILEKELNEINTEESVRLFEENMGFDRAAPKKEKINEPINIEPEPFKVHWIGEEEYKLKPREWLMKGYLKAGNITLLQAPPGSMKTIVAEQMIYCGASKKPFMGHEVEEEGNGLMICPEEDRNELELRTKAIEQSYGPITNGNRIAIRGIEHITHLVNFKDGNLYPGKDYESIKKFIKDNNIKYIHLDPLVSFQTGDFDENSNPQMDKYIKEFLIPLAKINNGCLILVHHSRKPGFQKANPSRTINPWESMNEARGASSLPAAARIVISLMPMTEGLWNALYKKLIPESEIFKHVAIIDAKNNYAATNQYPLWCIKQIQEVTAHNGTIIDIPVLQKSTLTELQNTKSEMHEEHIRKKCSEYIVLIEKHFPDKSIDRQEVSLHSIAKEIVATKTDISISKSGAVKKVVDELKKGFDRVHIVNGLEYIYYYDRWDSKAYHKMQRTDKSKVSINLDGKTEKPSFAKKEPWQ